MTEQTLTRLERRILREMMTAGRSVIASSIEINELGRKRALAALVLAGLVIKYRNVGHIGGGYSYALTATGAAVASAPWPLPAR